MSEQQNTRSVAIRVRNVAKRYEEGRIVALDGLDLDIYAGEFVAICGPSGCGKSTLLNMVTAIDQPDTGTIVVCGQAIEQMGSEQADVFRKTTVGLVFQLHNLLPNLTAIENVQVPMLGNGRSGPERVDRAGELLAAVGLGSRLDAIPTVLSGGERLRVAVARALANSPRVLLADEPTGALDSRTGDRLFELLTRLQGDLGMTMVVVTHDQSVASRAERVVHMLDGKVA